MMVAAAVTIIFQRLKQPVVLGYILAGVIIGPHTPPVLLIQSEHTIKILSELGIILLMFSLGLEFSLRKLKQVGVTAFIAASMEIILMLWIGYEIGRAFGWSSMDSLFLGAILSISSTTIIIKALGELGKTREKFAELIFGILIVEDMLAIVMLALLSGIAATGSLQPMEVVETVGKLGIFLVGLLVVGLLAVPKLIGMVAKNKNSEMLLITVLGLCFGVSLLALKLGYSVALGAFIIGAVIAESREIGKIETLIAPVRDMFSAIFFVAIGLLIKPSLLLDYAFPITIITAAVVIGKVLSCSLGTFVAGHDTRTSLKVGMGLAQIGEFSFIIASLGLSLKVTSDFLYPIAVTVSAITTLLTPYLIKSADGLVGTFDRIAPPKLHNHLELYTRWVGQLGHTQKSNFATKLIRRWILQMTLNLMLLAGGFIMAAFAARWPATWVGKFPGGLDGYKTGLWLAAMLLTLPLSIAVFRKLQALSILLSEISVSRSAAGARTQSIRSVISNSITTVGLMGLGLLILALSSTLLPSFNMLIVALLVLGVIVVTQWKSFIKIYSRAQSSLEETFSAPAPQHSHQHQEEPLPNLLKNAQLQTVRIPENAKVSGKLIRELQLRSISGASVVGIERSDAQIINPGPDEELRAGDQVLLLGSKEQLEKGRAVLLEQTA